MGFLQAQQKSTLPGGDEGLSDHWEFLEAVALPCAETLFVQGNLFPSCLYKRASKMEVCKSRESVASSVPTLKGEGKRQRKGKEGSMSFKTTVLSIWKQNWQWLEKNNPI